MTIYEELKKDHRAVLALFDRLIASGDDTADVRNGLIEQIRDELVPHSRAEEAVFYNVLREIGEGEAKVGHGYVEHLEAETMLRALQVAGKIDAGWRVTATKLRAALAHHIQEEETEIFAAAQKVLDTKEAEMIGKAFVAMKPAIKEQGLLGTSMDLIVNLMPTRFSSALKQFSPKA